MGSGMGSGTISGYHAYVINALDVICRAVEAVGGTCQHSRMRTDPLTGEAVVHFTVDHKPAVVQLLHYAVTADSALYKQRYLEQIAKVLRVELPYHEPGVPA